MHHAACSMCMWYEHEHEHEDTHTNGRRKKKPAHWNVNNVWGRS